MSATNRGQCRPSTGAASEKCHPATGATVSSMNRVRTHWMMGKSWAVMGNQAHRNGDSRGVQPRLTSTFLGADDGTRTRDPHLGKKKVISLVRAVPPSHLTWCSVHGFVHPVVLNPCRSGLVYYEARSSRRNRVRMSSAVDSSRPLVHDPLDGRGSRPDGGCRGTLTTTDPHDCASRLADAPVSSHHHDR